MFQPTNDSYDFLDGDVEGSWWYLGEVDLLAERSGRVRGTFAVEAAMTVPADSAVLTRLGQTLVDVMLAKLTWNETQQCHKCFVFYVYAKLVIYG